MNDEYFTVEEVAKKMKVSKSTIRRAIKLGRIHAFRPGVGKKSPWRIYESELLRILMVSFEKIKEENDI